MTIISNPSRQPAPNAHWCAGCTPENCAGCRPLASQSSPPYLYHYHAITQSTPGQTRNDDGILTCESLLSTPALYAEARLGIAKIAGVGHAPERLTICSLTLLNPH